MSRPTLPVSAPLPPIWTAPSRSSPSLGGPLSARQAFVMMLGTGCLLATVTHIAFAYLFWHHGIVTMVWVNVASVLCYALSALLLRRDLVAQALLLMMGEICAHAFIATVAVGWQTGFHLYLLGVVPIFLANQINGWLVRVFVSAVVAMGYIALEIVWHRREPWHPLPDQIIDSLHLFNLATTLGILASVTVLYVHLISQAERRLHELATTDSLTGLMNRRSMMAALQRLQTLRQRKPQPVVLILADIDHFKVLNDTHGHALGDWALQAVADVLSIGVRDVDMVARWGGEEFLIVLPDTPMEAGQQVAERLRLNIAALRFPLPQDDDREPQEQRLTATFGLAELAPDQSLEGAVHAADLALYRGKEQGRNQVVRAA